MAEREVFPRFHVGESLLPAMMPVLDRLGVRERVERHGFLIKFGAAFHDQESDLEYRFYFREGKPWPPYSYEVQRAEFDQILLEHAAKEPGVSLLQPAEVERVELDGHGATLGIREGGETRTIRARFVVDASGRDGFLASRHVGRREPIPGLGKVALFAHFEGVPRWEGRDEGLIRLYIFEDGWFWWIPFSGDLTSIGCVLHSKTVRGREGSLDALYDDMIGRCRRVAEGLRDARRVTPVRSAANFSYRTTVVAGDRFLCVGDSLAFVDPIFSSGVYVAMQTGEMAAAEILAAFADGRFEARRFEALRAAGPARRQPLRALHPPLVRARLHRDLSPAAREPGHARQRHGRPRRRRLPAHAAQDVGLAHCLLRHRARQSLGATLARPGRGVETRVVALSLSPTGGEGRVRGR